MEYRYDYDVKDDLLTLMENKQDFSGMEELADYLTMYHNERNFQKSALLKFCIYKLSANLSDVELKTFDCDVSKDVIESFSRTYRWLEDFNCQNQRNSTVKYELVNGEKSFRGDTMTSVWTVLKEYIKTKTGTYKISENDKWETYILREIDRINISKDAAEFIRLSHSIGDFIPVPPGFNTGRSNFGRWDSWDLTLTQIYRWYVDNPMPFYKINNRSLEALFEHDRNKQSSIDYCQEWLKYFGTWEIFVRENYLESFLQENGTPKTFFDGHSLTYPLPKTLNEFECFFKTVNDCIAQRGHIIIDTLIKRGYGKSDVEQKQSASMSGYNDAQPVIKDEFSGNDNTIKKKVPSKIFKWLKRICIYALIYIVCALADALFRIGLVPLLKFVTISAIIFYILFRFLFWEKDCHACGKHLALKKVSVDVIREEPISVLVKTKIKDNYGAETGSMEQYIPGTRTYYQETYVCKYCGANSYRTFSKEKANL